MHISWDILYSFCHRASGYWHVEARNNMFAGGIWLNLSIAVESLQSCSNAICRLILPSKISLIVFIMIRFELNGPNSFNNTEPSKTLRAELIEKCMQAWKGYSVENIAKYMYGSWSVQCYQEPIREDSTLMGSWCYTMRFTYTHTALVLLQCYTRHLYP